jgi:Ca2+-binding EF-hand superfamily protein
MEAHRAARAEKRKAKAAEKSEERQAKMMARLDTNKDGLLQKDKMSGHGVERMLKRMDKDGDGRISKAEAEEMGGKRRKTSE